MSWYDDWFNSEYYLKVYKHRDETEAERLIELILTNLDVQPRSKILDMACGSGRHSITLAKKNFDVTAVDISKNLIFEAEENALQHNVKIDFVLSDILKFETIKRFDLALNLFTSIGYFETDEDNFGVILKAYDLLNVGSYFVLDYFNKNFLLNNLIPTTFFSENGSKITQDRLILGDRVRKDITIENNGIVEKYFESVRLYSYDEIHYFVTKAGFTTILEFGDYNGQKYNRDSSSRLIMFGKK